MLLLTAVSQTQPDYVALAMVLVLLVFVAVAALRKRFSGAKVSDTSTGVSKEEQEESAKILTELPVAPGSAGHLKLHNVDPKTAAMLMAIVADKMGKPLNELRYISIKEVTDHEV